MNITISYTGDKPDVIARLREPSVQSDSEQAQCENAVRDALLEYLEENAGPGSVGVTVSISCGYTAKP